MNRRKLLALALALALCAGVLSGCGGSGAQDPAPNPGTQAPGDPSKTTLTVAIGNDISSIDPAGHNDTFSALVTNMLTSRLFTYDAAGNVIADAADTWSYETDTELVITIKKGITFQDGSEMKAEDVKASLDRAMESPNVAYVLDKIDHIEVVDDYTVKIVTQAPFAPPDQQHGPLGLRHLVQGPDRLRGLYRHQRLRALQIRGAPARRPHHPGAL